MAEDYTLLAQIEAYLRQEMSAEERVAFEQQLQTDEALQEEVKAYRRIFNGFRQQRLQQLNEKVKAFDATLPALTEKGKNTEKPVPPTSSLTVTSTRNIRRLGWRIAGVAAGILLLAVIGMNWMAKRSFSTLAQQQLPTVEEPSFNFLSDGPFERGKTAFFQQNYSEAIDALEKVNQNDPNAYILSQYYLAHSYARTNAFDKAIASYTTVLEANPIFLNMKQLQWERVLAYVGNHQFDATFQQELEEILQQPQHPYIREALQLQANLEGNFWRYWAW